MECLNNLLINIILDIMNQIKSQISSSVVHLSSGLTGIRTPGLDRHLRMCKEAGSLQNDDPGFIAYNYLTASNDHCVWCLSSENVLPLVAMS
jgi:hypothetical protein